MKRTSIGQPDHSGRRDHQPSHVDKRGVRVGTPMHIDSNGNRLAPEDHYLSEAMAAPKIGRDGRKPKPWLGTAVPAHGGMIHTADTNVGKVHVTGLSRQQTGVLAPDASAPNPQDPTVPGKVRAFAEPVFGQRSRTKADSLAPRQPGRNHADNVGRGGKVVDQMLAVRIVLEAQHGALYGSRPFPTAPSYARKR
jgi:hypothetical protein